MRACLFSNVPDADLLADVVDVYAAAFAQPPYHEGPEQADAFWERVQQYAAERDGFRLAVVGDDGDRVDAFGVAVLARQGDWWRDQVAAALGAVAAEQLGEVCLEVVHVAVRPSRQRRGLGRLTHDLLLAGTPAPRGVLACHPRAPAASDLYTALGWSQLGALPVEDGEPYLVFGRAL